LKVDQTLISKIETGDRKATPLLIEKVKNNFNITDEIFEFLALEDASNANSKTINEIGRYLLEVLSDLK
jgi:hypothetical protein